MFARVCVCVCVCRITQKLTYRFLPYLVYRWVLGQGITGKMLNGQGPGVILKRVVTKINSPTSTEHGRQMGLGSRNNGSDLGVEARLKVQDHDTVLNGETPWWRHVLYFLLNPV